jgi:hypothetical protein
MAVAAGPIIADPGGNVIAAPVPAILAPGE